MTKDEISILTTATSHFKQIRNIIAEIDDMLKKKIRIENVEFPSNIFLKKTSLLQSYFDNLRHQQLNTIYPNILWSSLFLTAYATFESALDLLSDYYHLLKNINISPNELKDRGVKRSEKYLTKLVFLKYPTDSHNWDSINELADIRHCIIHANGIVSQYNNSKTVYSIVEKYSEIKIDNDHIVLTKDFVFLFTTLCENFLVKLMQIN
jgi:hypothetical protein